MILTPLAAALINRFRGGGIVSVNLPGHRRFWAAPLMGLVALMWHPPLTALALTLAWFIWALLPWGRWYTLGRGDREWSGNPNWFERCIERFVSHEDNRIINDHLCLALRNLIALIPLALISEWAALGIVLGMALSYELAWRYIEEKKGPTGWGEIGTGFFWGLTIMCLSIS